MLSEKSKRNIDSCRFCWMCRHICPVGNATGLERNTARARALSLSMVYRGAESLAEMAPNLYECALCGACVRECVTGWDPVSFTVEAKTEASLSGVLPEYILKLIENFQKYGNIYKEGLKSDIKFYENKTDVLLYFGETTRFKNPDAIKDVNDLLHIAGVKYTSSENEESSGYSLFYLTGKTAETLAQMKKCAEMLNGYKKVVVYDPADLKLIVREYKESGVNVNTEIISFNEFLLNLINSKVLELKKTDNVYTPQDNFNYARELNETEIIREILKKAGNVKEMLLSGKDAVFSGSLIMNEYMPEVMRKVAENRWNNMRGMNLETIVTESPDEYVLLKRAQADNEKTLSLEQAVLKSL